MSFRGFVGLVSTLAAVIVILIGTLIFVEKVPEGKVAVVYSPSGGATEVLNPGWHLIGLGKHTTEYPTRIQVLKNNVSVSTNDGKKVDMSARYEVKVDKKKVLTIFRELGSQDIEQIQEGYLYMKLFKASRETISTYSLLDVYGTKTTEASATITKDFAAKVEPLGFIVTDVTLGTPKADKQTQAAIDARVAAAQQNEQKKLELENDKIDAERKAIQAKGDADKKIIAAEAEKKSNDLIEKSITPELLKKMEMEARIKHGWVEITGASVLTQK